MQPLITKYSETGVLTNDEIVQLLKLKNDHICMEVIGQLIHGMIATDGPPLHIGFKRLECYECGKPISGIAAVDFRGEDLDKYASRSLRHASCLSQ